MRKIEDFILDSYHYAIHYLEVYDVKNEDIFSTNIILNLSGPVFEIPYCLQFYAREALIRDKHYVVIPFPTTEELFVVEKKTTTNLLSAIIKSYYKRRINALKTPNGDKYYGLPGIIFNGEKELLFSANRTFEFRNDVMVKKEDIIRVSPLVFSSNKALEKSIVKKLIPSAINNGIKIIIDNYNIVERTKVPRIGAQEECNWIIRKHIDEI